MKIPYASGFTDDSILRHGVVHSATQFIGKPYTMEDLTHKIREVLGPKEAPRAAPCRPASCAASSR